MRRAWRFVRLVRLTVRAGLAAAPGAMIGMAALSVVSGVSASVYPYGFVVMTESLADRRVSGMWLAVTLTGGLIGINWIAAMFDATVGFGLVDRVKLAVSCRIATLVNQIPDVEYLDRPDVLEQLDMVERNRDVMAGAPRAVLNAAGTAVRAGILMALLASVRPVLLVLPLFAVAPLVAESRASRIRDDADFARSEDKRLGDALFTTAVTAATAKEVRIYGLRSDLLDRHAALSARIDRTAIRAGVRATVIAACGWAAFVAAFAGAIALVVRAAAVGDVGPGEVVLVVVVAQQLRLVLQAVAESLGRLLTSAGTMSHLLALEASLAARPGPTREPPGVLRSGIDLVGVSFRYPGADADSLSEVDLHLPAGATIAVVGENGAGKSTLIKLLTAMYRPTDGHITVDGVDLGVVDVAAWRSRVATVFQDFECFELRAFEVVGVGDLARVDDRAAIDGALRRSGGTDVLAALSDGLETELGASFPAGERLSMGQWQKLAVGRGMMRDDPLLLVLDEPTASIDAETEHGQFQLHRREASRTAEAVGGITVLISHRFSTVRDVDLIVVLDKGRVAEVGSHDELLRAEGLYAELAQMQARGYQ